jgi:hypothetical protein
MSMLVSGVGFSYDAHAWRLLSGSFIRAEVLHHVAETQCGCAPWNKTLAGPFRHPRHVGPAEVTSIEEALCLRSHG